jgi:hypothetical protein
VSGLGHIAAGRALWSVTARQPQAQPANSVAAAKNLSVPAPYEASSLSFKALQGAGAEASAPVTEAPAVSHPPTPPSTPPQNFTGPLTQCEPEPLFDSGSDDNFFASSPFGLALRQATSSKDLEGVLLPENDGRIKHIALTPSFSDNEKTAYLAMVKTLMAKMPTAKFTIVASRTGTAAEEVKSSIKAWAAEGQIVNPERITMKNGLFGSKWAQDSTLVMGSEIVAPSRRLKVDAAVPQRLATVAPDFSVREEETLFLDGGNQKATHNKVFVGRDAVKEMVAEMKAYPRKYFERASSLGIEHSETLSPEALAEGMIRKNFSKQEVNFVGTGGKQPAFHIDMALTPLGKPCPETGKPVLLIGDPSLAAKTLLDLKESSPQKYQAYQQNLQAKTGVENSLDKLLASEATSAESQAAFDQVAAEHQAEYKIVRVPYLGTLQGANQPVGDSGTGLINGEELAPNLPWITYNNSVIDGDQVFVPEFGIPELDQPAQNAYRKFGYETVPLDMAVLSQGQGAVNCMTKVLEREYDLPTK